MKKNLLIIASTIVLSLLFVQCNSKENKKEKESDTKSVEQIQSVQDGNTEGNVENSLQAIRTIMEEVNKQCPIMVDEITRLDKCWMSEDEKTVNYFYTLTDVPAIDMAVFKENIREVLVLTAKTNPDMKLIRVAKITVNYKYNDPKGNEIITVTVTPKDYE